MQLGRIGTFVTVALKSSYSTSPDKQLESVQYSAGLAATES